MCEGGLDLVLGSVFGRKNRALSMTEIYRMIVTFFFFFPFISHTFYFLGEGMAGAMGLAIGLRKTPHQPSRDCRVNPRPPPSTEHYGVD